MNLLELVKTRRSVRTFDGKPLAKEEIDSLKEYADTISNPYGIPVQFRFFDAKEYGLSSPVIQGESMYVMAKVPSGPNCEAAFGYTFEELVLKAWSMGIGTTWIGGTFKRETFEKIFGVEKDEIMCCVSPLGYPAKKLGLKESLMRKAVKADWRKPAEELFFDGNLSTPLATDDAKISEALETVRLAPSAVNLQPWRIIKSGNRYHFYVKHSKGYGNGAWDMQKIDIGIALNHFMKATGGKLELADPEIAVDADMDYMATVEVE